LAHLLLGIGKAVTSHLQCEISQLIVGVPNGEFFGVLDDAFSDFEADESATQFALHFGTRLENPQRIAHRLRPGTVFSAPSQVSERYVTHLIS
jgi:hypothetical protein